MDFKRAIARWTARLATAALLALPATAAQAGGNALAELKDLGSQLGLAQPQEFLQPDEAFALDGRVESGDTVRLHWDIADGYYLYREQLKVEALAPQGLRIVEVQWPKGKEKHDEFFGEVEIYQHALDGRVRVALPDGASGRVELRVRYQGCAEAGLCYPPITRTVAVDLSQAGAPPAADTGGAPEHRLPVQDQIAQTLLSGNRLWVLGSFFVFGLLLAFTPCVFPMIPILSGIIAGHGPNLGAARAFGLSLVYVLAVAVTYSAAGVAAGLLGENLQAYFQHPAVLITFALVFVALALSMFGVFTLQLPAALQSRLSTAANRVPGGSWAGAAVMGFFSALIVGPCVAPPLAGALIYIGQSGDAVLGGAALFALSLGMGVPLLAVGTSIGKWLPKAGPWMERIKAVFGILLLAVAIWLLGRLVPASIYLLLWAALAAGSAIYFGALRRWDRGAGGWALLGHAASILLLVYGLTLVVGAAGGATDPLRPWAGLRWSAGGERGTLAFTRIENLAELEAALARARAEGRPVMVDLYADWCISCKEMEHYTFSDARVRDALDEAVLLQIDMTEYDADDKAFLQHFGLIGPPTILFFDRNGRERPDLRIIGFMKADEFLAHLDRAFD